MKDNKLVRKFGLVILCLFFLIVISNLIINSCFKIDDNAKASIFISICSIAATLLAPIAAFLFYDNWRIQTKFNRVTTNILELQKILHSYVTELKFLRNRIIFPYLRNKFENEDDYFNNLKKLLDHKLQEINVAERLKYDSHKMVSIIRNDTQGLSECLDKNLRDLDYLIDNIYMDIQQFKHNYFVFINHYYKEDSELKSFMKTDEYKSLTYKISSTRETNNVIKTNLKIALTLEERKISPETTLNISKFIQDIDILSKNLLKNYEDSFKD